ncbi:MAG: GNAT family N-acetyltransferase, partial [Acidobacteriota bacterium]
MPSYRFCRPDDMPRLVQAINECYNAHFPGNPPLTLDNFQREVRELNVWPSNCMIAWRGEEPIAVSIATKREREVLVQRVGVRPGHQRQGHGLHLVTSLSQKLAVLGPSRL